MPTYLYRFNDTDEVVEVHHSIHDDALTEIDGRPVRRIYKTVVPTIFNASGFYRTDNR